MGVDFDIFVDQRNIKKCGLKCREVSATLRNTGNQDAREVNVIAQFFCKGKRIDVNGGEFLEIHIGKLNAETANTETFKLVVGFRDSLCIKSNGVRVIFTITSQEMTKKIEKVYYL